MDNEQELAVTLRKNGIITAGAGSGKTMVLANRYVWLLTGSGEDLNPDEILALTFTNKAVSEMYNRIYRILLEKAVNTDGKNPAGQLAARALNNFYRARISTLDSFSANIARIAAPRYGISPDFKNDDLALKNLAREAALQFVLDNRETAAIRQLLPDHKIRSIAEGLFAEAVLKYSPVSSPLDLDKFLLTQKIFIKEHWHKKIKSMEEVISNLKNALRELDETQISKSFPRSLNVILCGNALPAVPDIDPLLEIDNFNITAEEDSDPVRQNVRQQIKNYFDYYSGLAAVNMSGNYGEAYADLKENFRCFKGTNNDGLFHELRSIANYCLNFGLCGGVYELLKIFQAEFNNAKRTNSILSFNDIAHLAADALKDHPDIRKVYKDSVKMILIDEFQDNNALQRDLVYLLAEKSGRTEKSIPSADELENNRLFFVGDEKQSIYRFRGADVAVFRTLGKDLFKGRRNGGQESGFDGASGSGISLVHNYRSSPVLINAFNHIFDKIFLTARPELSGQPDLAGQPDSSDIPDYEAVYVPALPPEDSEQYYPEAKPPVHFCFLDSDELPDDDYSGIKSYDLEAIYIAKKIRDLIDSGEKVPRRRTVYGTVNGTAGGTANGIEWTPCVPGDFAVLQRSYTHQSSLEKYFREFGIPCSTDRPSGLFNDSPVLDMRAYLRLLVYPGDRIAYAALIRSPFMRLSDNCLAVCMLSKNPDPFTEENDELIPEDELQSYRRARDRYRAMREASRVLPVTGLLIKLWYEEGYCYETLWTQSAQVYENLFDMFFGLASDSDARGNNLAEFIDYLEDVINREEKPDDKDIPGEGEPGVKIMSIHKAKGLEFPFVFIYNAAKAANFRRAGGLVNFHPLCGPIFDLPAADELPAGGNFLREVFQREEKQKELAELRRLLYVAMTRAEYQVYLTFTLPGETIEKIKNRDTQYFYTQESGTFLKLLMPVFNTCPPELYVLESIPVTSGQDSVRHENTRHNNVRHDNAGYTAGETITERQKNSALIASSFYDSAAIIPQGEAFPGSIEAGRLRYETFDAAAGISVSLNTQPENDSDISAQINPADFGSFVHEVLEARLKGQEPKVSQKIQSAAGSEKALLLLQAQAMGMADLFFDSVLGKRFMLSINHETEFPVITSVVINGKPVAITGRMDLFFEEENEIVIVDFKTDKIKNPEDHYGQMAAYYRAAVDIFNKPVSVWLFYLRRDETAGNAVNVTDKIRDLPLEEMAARV
ncbi:MAG: UvrD-helicase domain-containing protein [Treponema sp.]|nr:UvrD-helicase domain-containing protein [Treponema sp.]